MRLSRAAVRRAAGAAESRMLRTAATAIATPAFRSHPCLFSRGLRTSRDCDQRFCDRPTTSKQTAATKHSIRAKNFSGSTRIPSVSGESRQKTWRQNESAVPPPPVPRLKPRSVPGHPPPNQTQQNPSSQTGVRPPPPLRSLTPTYLMDSPAAPQTPNTASARRPRRSSAERPSQRARRAAAGRPSGIAAGSLRGVPSLR
jgi:hypothetical protein